MSKIPIVHESLECIAFPWISFQAIVFVKICHFSFMEKFTLLIHPELLHTLIPPSEI